MTITIFDTAEEVGRAVAQRVIEALRHNPHLVMGLPAGQTPVSAYGELRRRHATGDVSFSNATAFLLDEFVGLGPSDRSSFRRFIARELLSGIDLASDRVHSLNGSAHDLDAECARYERAIAAAGGLGFMLLGIGANGHIGFNEPGEALVSRTHRVRLLESTRRDNAGLFDDDLTRVPNEALSMGMGTILGAETVALIATGARKASAVAGMINGPVTARVPASFLQLHRRVEVSLDRAAASAL